MLRLMNSKTRNLEIHQKLMSRVCLLGRATIATGSRLGRVAVVVELYVSVVGCWLLSFWLACAFSWHLDAFAAG